MKPYLYLLAFALVACHNSSEEKESVKEELTNYVNPFIGTDGTGNTYPGAMTPFGMVQLSPDIGIPGWDRISGYFYPDSIITGFSHTHLRVRGLATSTMYSLCPPIVDLTSVLRQITACLSPISLTNTKPPLRVTTALIC